MQMKLEADHPPPSTAKVNNAWNNTSISPCAFSVCSHGYLTYVCIWRLTSLSSGQNYEHCHYVNLLVTSATFHSLYMLGIADEELTKVSIKFIPLSKHQYWGKRFHMRTVHYTTYYIWSLPIQNYGNSKHLQLYGVLWLPSAMISEYLNNTNLTDMKTCKKTSVSKIVLVQ